MIGPGAYKTNNFEELFDAGADIASSDVSKEWLEPAELTEIGHDSKLYKAVEIPQDKLKEVRSYSFSFWHRFSYYDPKRMNIDVFRGNYLGVAGITEKDSYCDWTTY